MKELVIRTLSGLGLTPDELERLIEPSKVQEHGDYAFPCFTLAQKRKRNPVELARDIAGRLKFPKEIARIEAVGPYINFFINAQWLASEVLDKIFNKGDAYGRGTIGKGKTVVIDMSSPNIAKPFGVGHLRSTIIGNSIALIHRFLGYTAIRLNYLGDWGTPFGKIIAGYKRFGDAKKLKEQPIKHLYDIYVKVSKDEEYDALGKEEFLKMEQGDVKTLALWRQFKELSIKEFKKMYDLLGVDFEITSGESLYNNQLDETVELLRKKGLLEMNEGAEIVNLEHLGLGVALIKKSDGATLYMTRDIAAALDRHMRYKADALLYEVGSEQKLHFKQLFQILEMLGNKWAKQCVHIDHGLYLDNDGKKFSTRKGKLIFMEEILDETIELAKKELKKRSELSSRELSTRALAIARAAIIYGDLKNYRAHDTIFDIDRFVSFEGDTGPYLLYSYARAQSIVRKAGRAKKGAVSELGAEEHALVKELARFPDIVEQAVRDYAPNGIAHYAYTLAQTFNEFYHKEKVIGSEREAFRLNLVRAFAQTLKNALTLLGIPVLEEM